MGIPARGLYPVVGLAALGQTLLDLGARVDVGAGVEATLAEISQATPTPA
jgi:pyridoxamine--pyruvate transaminase